MSSDVKDKQWFVDNLGNKIIVMSSNTCPCCKAKINTIEIRDAEHAQMLYESQMVGLRFEVWK